MTLDQRIVDAFPFRAGDGYMGAKRKAPVERFGYDCKHASHAVRILRMGIEFCASGEYHVWRDDRDADELRAIKRGEWPREAVLQEIDRLLTELDLASNVSPLPAEPDAARIEELVMRVLTDHVADGTRFGADYVG